MNASAPRVRPAIADDAGALALLYTELGYPSSTDEIARRLPRILADDDHRVLVAENDSGAVIGSVHIGLLAILERDLSAQIMGLVVSTAYRRRGVGRALIAAAEEWAGSRGCGMVYVRTNIVRPAAPAFYAGMGYVNTKTQHAFRKPLFPAP